MTANLATPILGAALTTKTLAIHRGWILEQQRDLEIQDLTVLIEAKSSQMPNEEFQPYLLRSAVV